MDLVLPFGTGLYGLAEELAPGWTAWVTRLGWLDWTTRLGWLSYG